MNRFTYLRRSLRFHARAHLGAFLGAAVGSAVLTGALLVGDSVRYSLAEMGRERLGRIHLALASGDRFFRAGLARDLTGTVAEHLAPGLQFEATATGQDEATRANRVQLLGVDERFWRLGLAAPEFPSPGPDEVLLNAALAAQLRARAGDELVFRVPRPTSLSREAPLTPQQDDAVALRLTVCGVVPDRVLGRFSLQPSQVPPFNAFVHLPTLQDRLRLPGRANRLLAGETERSAAEADAALRQHWDLADAELQLRPLPNVSGVELRSPRVFLDPPVADAARRVRSNAVGVLTYFVTELRHGDRATPYSMVAAVEPPWVPADLADDEIVINDWLANDLAAAPGDTLELTYFAVGTARRLVEQSARLRVRAVVPLTGAAADPELMPDFPGIEPAESTRDWDPSLPVTLSRIRPQDEEYWKAHRGTPKAFLSLATGQKLWGNRFGALTAIRFLTAPGEPPIDRPALAAALRRELDPAAVGVRFLDVQQQGRAAVAGAQDFGGLFIGFSFFLMGAALLLMALLFLFGIEQRAVETGTLLALGFTGRQVRQLLWAEGALIAAGGSAVGLLGAIAYARIMVQGLGTIWRHAVGTAALRFHAEPATLLIGAAAAGLVAALTIALALRRQASRPARELLTASGPDAGAGTASPQRWYRRPSRLALLAVVAALGLTLQALVRGDTASAGTFFGAGALLLVAGVSAAAAGLGRLDAPAPADRFSLTGLAIRNTSRRRGRSLATLGLLASGTFLVLAISVFRLDAGRNADRRDAGTGGFAWIGETTLPVVVDLNTPAGREAFALDSGELDGVSLVPFRVRDGDEASCLNLNRAQQPRLLGVNPDALADRSAFTFAQVAQGLEIGQGWRLLRSAGDALEPEVPAIGDLNSILWAMGRRVGDRIPYTDDRGRTFQVRIVAAIANSVLQGGLLIDEAAFLQRFPGEAGYRMFLVDTPSNARDRVSTMLTRALRDVGLELVPAVERLAAFNAVQNTYLGTFQILGGLGLILGTLGLAVVVLRNVLDRRAELAVLLAVGFRLPDVRRLILGEHGALLLAGLTLGLLAAAVAVLPALGSPGNPIPWGLMAGLLGTIVLTGWVAAAAATWMALRGSLLPALRNE